LQEELARLNDGCEIREATVSDVCDQVVRLDAVSVSLGERDVSLSGDMEDTERVASSLLDGDRSLELKDKQFVEQRGLLEEYCLKISDLEGQLIKYQQFAEGHGVMTMGLLNRITYLNEELQVARGRAEEVGGDLSESYKTSTLVNDEVPGNDKITEDTSSKSADARVSTELFGSNHQIKGLSDRLAGVSVKIKLILDELVNAQCSQKVENVESRSEVTDPFSASLSETVKGTFGVEDSAWDDVEASDSEFALFYAEIGKLIALITPLELSARQSLNEVAELRLSLDSKTHEAAELYAKCEELSNKCERLAAKCKQLMEASPREEMQIKQLEQYSLADNRLLGTAEVDIAQQLQQQVDTAAERITADVSFSNLEYSFDSFSSENVREQAFGELRPATGETHGGDNKQLDFLECPYHLEAEERSQSLKSVAELARTEQEVLTYQQLPLDSSALAKMELRLHQYEKDVLQCLGKGPTEWISMMSSLKALDDELLDITSLIASAATVSNVYDCTENGTTTNLSAETANEAAICGEVLTEKELTDKQPRDLYRCVMNDVASHVKAVRFHVEHKLHDMAGMVAELATLNNRLTSVCHQLEDKDNELSNARLAVEACEIKFEKLKARSISKLKELTARHQVSLEQKHSEFEEVKRELSERTAESNRLDDEVKKLQNELVESEKLGVIARKRIEELQMLVETKNEQLLLLTEKLTTDLAGGDELRNSGDRGEGATSREQAETGTSEVGHEFVDADRHRHLETCLSRAKCNLSSVLDVGDDVGPGAGADNCDELLLQVERCSQLVSNLRRELREKEEQMSLALASVGEKEALAKKYAVAAKKLKQQVEEMKRNASFTEDRNETSRMSKFETESSEKESKLKLLEATLEEKELRITALLQEVSALTESRTTEALKSVEDSKKNIAQHELPETATLTKDGENQIGSSKSVTVDEEIEGVETLRTADNAVGDDRTCDLSLTVDKTARVEFSPDAHVQESALSHGEDEIQTLKQQIDVLNTRLVESERQLVKMRQEYDEIAVQRNELKIIIDGCEKQLQDKEAVWKHEHEALRAQVSILEEAYNEKASELEKQSEERAQIDNGLRQRVEDLEQQVLELRMQIAERDVIISDSANRCSSSDSEARSLKEHLEVLREEIERYKDECERRQNVIAEKEVLLVQSSESAKETVNRENKLKVVIKKLKSQVEHMKTDIVALEEQLVELKAEKERVDAQLSEATTLLADREAKLTAAEIRVQEQNEQLEMKDQTIAEANDRLQREEEVAASRAEELEQTCNELQSLRRDYELLESRYDETTSSLNRLLSADSERNSALELQVAEKDRQLQDVEEKMRELEPLVQVIESLQSKVDHQDTLLAECSSKISQLTAENHDLVRKLEAVGSAVEMEASSVRVFKSDAVQSCERITEENVNRQTTTETWNQVERLAADAAEISTAVDCISDGVRPNAEVLGVTVDSDFGLVELRSQLETLFKANSDLQNSLEETGMKVDMYTAENSRLEQLNDQLLTELNQLKSHLADVEVELCTLKTELSEQKNKSPAGGQSLANMAKEQQNEPPEISVGWEGPRDQQEGHIEKSPGLPESPRCHMFADQLMNVRVESEIAQRSSARESVTLQLQQLEDVERRCAAVELERNSLLKELRCEKDKNANSAVVEIQMKTLQEENKNYAAQIESLSSVKEKMLTKLKQLKEANDQFRFQVERLEKQADDTAAALRHAETDRQLMHADCELLREQLSAAEKKANEARLEVDRKQQEMLAAEENHCASVRALQDKVNSFELTVLQKQEQLDIREAEVSALNVEIEQVRSSLVAYQAEKESSVSVYEQRIAGLISENSSLTKSIEKLQVELLESHESSARKVADLQLLHDTVMNDAESLQDMVQQLTTEKCRLEQVVRESCSSAEKLKADLDALRVENAGVLLEREKLENRLEELENSFADEKQNYEDNVKELSGSAAALESELGLAHRNSASLQEEIDGLNWKIQELSETEEELQQLQNELFAVQSENGMLKKKLNSVERELDDRGHKVNDANAALLDEKAGLLAEIAQMKSELTRTSELARSSSEMATAKRHHDSRSAATQTAAFSGIDAATQCVDDGDKEAERWRTALATANGELVRAKAENAQLQSTVASLQSDLENLQTSLATYDRQHQRGSLARPVFVDQCVQTTDWRSDRKAVPSGRKREVSWKTSLTYFVYHLTHGIYLLWLLCLNCCE
jgi:chromosome segregation ATPase